MTIEIPLLPDFKSVRHSFSFARSLLSVVYSTETDGSILRMSEERLYHVYCRCRIIHPE